MCCRNGCVSVASPSSMFHRVSRHTSFCDNHSNEFFFTVSRLQHGGPLHFCTTPPCLEAAADLLSKQNASHNPCVDFWDYSCGGWLSRNPIPPTRTSWSTVEALRTELITEKSRLITTSAHEPSQFNSVEWKVTNFYASCMALSFIESDHEKPLLKVCEVTI